MKRKHRQVRFPEVLDERVARQMQQENQNFSEAVRELVEKGLVYGDLETYNLAKSVSQLAGSYDDLREQLIVMEGVMNEVVETMAQMSDALVMLNQQVRTADARYPTIIRTLGEVTLLCRLLAEDKGTAALTRVRDGIEKKFGILIQSIADEIDRRTSEATSPTA